MVPGACLWPNVAGLPFIQLQGPQLICKRYSNKEEEMEHVPKEYLMETYATDIDNGSDWDFGDVLGRAQEMYCHDGLCLDPTRPFAGQSVSGKLSWLLFPK